jgi:hypothetical protein
MSKSTLNKILLLCVIIAGCYTQKTALRHLQKAKIKQPGITSKFVAEQYPPSVISSDTIIRIDTGYIMVPVYNTDTIHLTNFDKTDSVKTKIVKVDRIKVVTKVVTVTNKIIDSAKVSDLLYQLNQCKADKERTKDKSNNLIFWLMVIISTILLLILLNYLIK